MKEQTKKIFKNWDCIKDKDREKINQISDNIWNKLCKKYKRK